MTLLTTTPRALLTLMALLALWAGAVQADEATIRKNLAERLPNFPKMPA